MSILEIGLSLVSGLIIGFTIGLTGIGGGVLVMPALIIILKIEPSVSVGTASLYALLTKIYAVFEHFRLRTINLTIAIFFLIGAIPANILTSLSINTYIKNNAGDIEKIKQFQGNLKSLIAYILLFSVIFLIIQLIKGQKTDCLSNERQGSNEHSTIKKIAGIISGVIVGVLIGSTSVGGGVLIIPLLIIFFNLSTKQTVGTSILIAVILVLSTSIIYGRGGQIDYWTSIIMAVGSIPGVFWGSRLSVKTPEKILKIIVTSIIMFAAIMMFIGNSGH